MARTIRFTLRHNPPVNPMSFLTGGDNPDGTVTTTISTEVFVETEEDAYAAGRETAEIFNEVMKGFSDSDAFKTE